MRVAPSHAWAIGLLFLALHPPPPDPTQLDCVPLHRSISGQRPLAGTDPTPLLRETPLRDQDANRLPFPAASRPGSLPETPAQDRVIPETPSAVSTDARIRFGADQWTRFRDEDGSPDAAVGDVGDVFEGFQVNLESLRRFLERAHRNSPSEFDGEGFQLALPSGNGSWVEFGLRRSMVLPDVLAARFPAIMTFQGRALDDPTLSVRADWTTAGFHAQIFDGSHVTILEPHGRRRSGRFQFRDASEFAEEPIECLVDEWASIAGAPDGVSRRSTALLSSDSVTSLSSAPPSPPQSQSQSSATGSDQVGITRFRLAVAAQGEYTRFHGGTVEAGLGAIAGAVNRVNEVLTRDMAVEFQLVAENDRIVFVDPDTDPYGASSVAAAIHRNQTVIDERIGFWNYDVGHVMLGIDGGLAFIGSACVGPVKARAASGAREPKGPRFEIEVFAHELAHQLGANHTFNGVTGNCGSARSLRTSMEPGSGSTIMSYAGRCGVDDFENHKDSYFHVVNLIEVRRTLGETAGCGVVIPSSNRAPTVDAGNDRYVPVNTPFTLHAVGSDPDGDSLVYCWEQFDSGSGRLLDDAFNDTEANRSGPLFRSVPPVATPARTFPNLTGLLDGREWAEERLPTRDRALTFMVTARDQRPDGGGVAWDEVTLNVISSAGPFRVESPGPGTFAHGWTEVTWDPAGTAEAPIDAATVNIRLSLDGGATFDRLLATGTANDGSETVLLPPVNTRQARIKVEATENVFFALNPGDFTVRPSADPWLEASAFEVLEEECVEQNGALDPGETVRGRFTLVNTGAGPFHHRATSLMTRSGISGTSSPIAQILSVDPGASLTRDFQFTVHPDVPCGATLSLTLQLDSADGTQSLKFPVRVGRPALRSVEEFDEPNRLPDGWTASPGPGSDRGASWRWVDAGSALGAAGVLLTPPDPSAERWLISRPHTVLNLAAEMAFVHHHDFEDGYDGGILEMSIAGGPFVEITEAGGRFLTGGYDGILDASNPFRSSEPAWTGGSIQPIRSTVRLPRSASGQTVEMRWRWIADATVTRGEWIITGVTWTDGFECCDSLNRPPSMNPPDNLVIEEDAPARSVTLTGLTGNGPGRNESLSVTVTSNHPALLPPPRVSGDAASGTLQLELMPVPDRAGLARIGILLDDGGLNHHTSVYSFTVEVVPVNDPPTLMPVADQTIGEGETLLVKLRADDRDTPSEQLRFSLDNAAPAGSVVDAGSGRFSWVPAENQGPGTYPITVTVSDGETPPESASRTFRVTVSERNRPPTLDLIPAQTIVEQTSFSLFLTATDPDLPAQPLQFSLPRGGPPGLTLDRNTGRIAWTSDESQGPATHDIEITVADNSDPQGIGTGTMTIHVLEANRPPVFGSFADPETREGDPLYLTLAATDPDWPRQTIRYAWGPENAHPDGALLDSDTGEITWLPGEDHGGSVQRFSVVATDDGDPPARSTHTFQVTVRERNEPPTFAPQPARTIAEGSPLLVFLEAADIDIPAQRLRFHLEQGAPAGARIDPLRGIVQWTTREDQGGQTHRIRASVRDDGTPPLSALLEFDVTVREVNSPPILSRLPAEIILREFEPLTLKLDVRDTDLPRQSLMIDVDPLPDHANLNRWTREFFWRPGEDQGPGTWEITFAVTDDGQPARTTRQTIRVVVLERNSPPILEPIGDRWIPIGAILQFNARAVDRDRPGQLLAFHLGPGAPAGAEIDPSMGDFHWAPTGAQRPSTNVIDVIVTDSGSPPASGTNRFTVIAEGPVRPLAIDVEHAGGSPSGRPMILLTLDAAPNEACVIEASPDMIRWTPIATHFADHLGRCSVLIEADRPGFFYRARTRTERPPADR